MDTLNQRWAKDKSKFGYQMLVKMGWSEGKGAGKNEDGMASHVKVKKRQDQLGLGTEVDNAGNAAFLGQISGFASVLANLNAVHGSSAAKGKRKRANDNDSTDADSDSNSAAVENDGETDARERKDKKKRKKESRKAGKPHFGLGGDASDAGSKDGAEEKAKKQKKLEKAAKKAKKAKRDVATERKAHARLMRAKDVSRYSRTDLNAILGVAGTVRDVFGSISAAESAAS